MNDSDIKTIQHTGE